ncbi:MAG: nuclear transport factor 2 family protein [Bacteroidetes bacterium]|nr:nuclear transport factor 2 family protein [Bacteroidota bacterium]
MGPTTYKEIAKQFLMNAAKGNARIYFDQYLHTNFKHHNVYFKGDAQTLLLATEENAKNNPDKTFEIKRILQDGELVAVHSHATLKKDDPGFALIHIFQFKEGKIIEMWDFGQAVPPVMVNENGMF